MKTNHAVLLTLALATLFGYPSGHAAIFSHYSFDTGYGDSSGNGRHGTLTDDGTVGNSAIATGAGDSQFGGGSMFFSSDRDYVDIPSKTFGTGSAYTIAFWARKAPGDTGDPALWDMVIGQRDNDIFFLGLNNGDGFRWRSNTNVSGIRQVDWSASDDSDWHHFALTADNSKNLSFYQDGLQVGSTVSNVETGIILDTIGEAYSTSRDFDFHGNIDEMWIFDEALDAAAVANLKNYNNIAIPEPSSLAFILLSVTAIMVQQRRRRSAPPQ